MKTLMRAPVIFDGRNLFTREQMKQHRLHLPLHWPAANARRRPRHRRRRLHRQPRGRRRCARPATTSSSTTTCRPGIARRRSAPPLIEGDIRDVDAGPRGRCATPAPSAVMHFAAWLSVSDSVARSGRLLPQQRARHARHARGDGRGAVPQLHLLVHLRDLRRAGRDADQRDAPARRRSTPTARPSWPSSTRCRTSSAPTASARSGCATSTPPAPIPDGELGEDHVAGDPRHSARLRGRVRRRAARDLRRGLSDAGRHLPARLHPRDRSGRRARARAGAPRRGRGVGDLQRRAPSSRRR